MTWFAEILALLRNYPAEIAIVGGIVTFVWPVWQFFAVRRQEARNREFKTFHRLIKELVQPEKDARMYLERQMAVVYELRNFPRYRKVTVRMLEGLKVFWSAKAENIRLIEEIDITLAYLKD